MSTAPLNERAANARFAAEYLFEAAITGDAAHMDRARQAVLALADHAGFGEMVISELALVGIERHGANASEYFAAECGARRALARFLPQLVGPDEPQRGTA
jgi:hypothetical protein